MINKIHKYNFLIVGAGLIGSLAGLHLIKKGYKVLVVDINLKPSKDRRTLAVNANSKDFLINLGLWKKLKNKPQPINKIIIKDYINKSPLIFENKSEEMGNVIFNNELLSISRNQLKKTKSIIEINNLDMSLLKQNRIIKLNNYKYYFDHFIISLGKAFNENTLIKKYSIPSTHQAFVGFFDHNFNHNQTAYEFFTKNGPLAVLPSPDKDNKSSTFIYSTEKKLSNVDIFKIIKKNFSKTHGTIKPKKNLSQFSISPHICRENANKFFLIGDSLRSIHPVAGQGWNLGIKDINALSELFDKNDLSNKNLVKKYYQKRILESTAYLSFTSIINLLYDKQNPIFHHVIKLVFSGLIRFSSLRSSFIKLAMGRSHLV